MQEGGKIVVPKGEVKGNVLVRCGTTGQPKFDNPTTVPDDVKLLLTLGEMLYLDERLIDDLGLLPVRHLLQEILR